MITLFTTPKPFRGHIATIQRNAIQSWLRLRPPCEILVLGDDEGTADVAAEFGLRHIPAIARNEYGTPLLDSIFESAQASASYPLLAYLNADIILLSDFVSAAQRIPFRRFVMVGRRWDLDLNRALDFSHPGWEADLRAHLAERGVLHGIKGMDYFVFPAGLWGSIPSFAIGRPAWDNWMIYRAYTLGIAVVDATSAITAVHQTHDYAHVPAGTGQTWEGPEARRNRALAGNLKYNFNLADANWRLDRRWLLPLPAWRGKKKYLAARLRQQARNLPVQHARLYRALEMPIRLYKRLFTSPHQGAK